MERAARKRRPRSGRKKKPEKKVAEPPMHLTDGEGQKTIGLEPMEAFRRFLLLGTEGNVFTANEQFHWNEGHLDSLKVVMARGEGPLAVSTLKTFSKENLCPKQDVIFLSLAYCVLKGDVATREAGYEALREICRIPTHIFLWLHYQKQLNNGKVGWGRRQRTAVRNWYKAADPLTLAHHVTKYRARSGWAHADLIKLAHIDPTKCRPATATVLCYVMKGLPAALGLYSDKPEARRVLDFLGAVEEARTALDPADVSALIAKHRLVREHVPTWLLDQSSIWVSLLQEMPLTALIRNLSKMTSVDLFAYRESPSWTNYNTALVQSKLANRAHLAKSRVHPFALLTAWKTYEAGSGDRGKLVWKPEPLIVQSLEKAFYMSFSEVAPSRKRLLLGVSIAPSTGERMTSQVSLLAAVACMVLVTVNSEPHVTVVAFDADRVARVKVKPSDSIDTVVSLLTRVQPSEKTAASNARPIRYAEKKQLAIDTFVIFNDSSGEIHGATSEALNRYRRHSPRFAAAADQFLHSSLISVDVAGSGTPAPDPTDPGMLHIVGFSPSVPQIIAAFSRGLHRNV